MKDASNTVIRIQTRNGALQMLNRLTAGVVFAAVAGVGLLGVVSAHTIPGASSSSTASTTGASTATSSTSTGVQSSSTSVSHSSSSGVAVSGGS